MNYILSCFPDEMAQSRRVGQCSEASSLVCSLKQKLGVPWVLLYSLGSLKFGPRSLCRVLCFPLRSLSAILCHSSIPSLVPGTFRWPSCVVVCCCHCWCSGCAVSLCSQLCQPGLAHTNLYPGTGAGVPVQSGWRLPAFREAAGKSLPGNAPWSTRQGQTLEQNLALAVSMGFGSHAKDMGMGILGSAGHSRREGSHPSIACRSKNQRQASFHKLMTFLVKGLSINKSMKSALCSYHV